MKIKVTFEISDEIRLAINYRYGANGMATRNEIENEIQMIVKASLDDYVYEFQNDE